MARLDSILEPSGLTGDYPADLRREAVRRVKALHAADRDKGVRKYLLDRCKEDYFFFRDSFLWIEDMTRHMSIPSMPLPHHDDLARYYLGIGGYRMPSGELYNVGVESSRGTGKTTGVSSPALWKWLFGGTTRQVFVSLSVAGVDAKTANFEAGMLDKVRYMVRRLPWWMKPEEWRVAVPRFVDKYKQLINPWNDSLIEGYSRNVEGLRGTRAFRVYMDEVNFIPHFGEMVRTVAKVGPFFFTSTPKGRHTDFAKYMHGEMVPLIEHPSKDGGLVKLRFHYSMMPDYDESTEAGRQRLREERGKMTDAQWASEMEIDYTASMPGRIWADWYSPVDEIDSEGTVIKYANLLSKRSYIADYVSDFHNAVIVDGYDFGDFSLTSWCRCAWYPSSGELLVLDYNNWGPKQDFREVAAYIKGAEARGLPPVQRSVGDISGASRPNIRKGGRIDSQAATPWIRNLRGEGIQIKGQTIDWRVTIADIRQGLEDGRVLLAPTCAKRKSGRSGKYPSMVDVITAYRWHTDAEDVDFVGVDAEPSKTLESHLADALQHAAKSTLCRWYTAQRALQTLRAP